MKTKAVGVRAPTAFYSTPCTDQRMQLSDFISLTPLVQAMNDLSAWRFMVIAALVFAWICSRPAIAYFHSRNQRLPNRQGAVSERGKASTK
ncbi:hypothetical protein LV564_05055 [Komagataeibacter nataicola]|uniref:hypothetical protein n=1 Tax=Komagataeibacter nataicola TaxID=265960 RepID=UPI0011B68942|nr:hypothetical protein [Komagataeibacter nataicola]WEQ56456.1 hypothetical protein LV564_05055 [Komagataeibacter nataicola]WNM09422.1 hypothetical protein RI056_05560 [Komagataeibacter nataicola]